MQSCAILSRPWREPLEVLTAFADEPFALAFLSGGGGPRARWSYVARRPATQLTLGPADPTDAMRPILALLGPGGGRLPEGPPFQGGLAGVASYEFSARLEAPGLTRLRGWPDLCCGLYLSVLAFDHDRRQVLAIGRGADPQAARGRAEEALEWLHAPADPDRCAGPLCETFEPQTSDKHYSEAVGQVVERIACGEIFQANIARAWACRLVSGARPFDLLTRLAQSSPAPFASYMRLSNAALVSNSPERFLRVAPEGDRLSVETRPIKGTRPRGADPAEDRRLAQELVSSVKDRAENLMIVDLMRNDLSRVCEQVETTELFVPEAFANVHHLVSTVVGRMRAGLGGLDAFMAAFPPGSVTGAPKIQAMKVIGELEPPRGGYCGSMFWAGFDGALDSSVLIRTALCVRDDDGWRVEARAGAGIVADSDPRAEAQETSDKIRAIAAALRERI